VNDRQWQPAPLRMSARPVKPTQVHTAADAAARLHRRATEFHTQAVIEPSPIHATALRKAGTTLNALAAAIDHQRHYDTAAPVLHLARDYRQAHLADLRDPDLGDYQIVCGHLADTLTEVSTRLRRAAAAERTRRTRAAAQPHVAQRNL
jgi:hypothetical protein